VVAGSGPNDFHRALVAQVQQMYLCSSMPKRSRNLDAAQDALRIVENVTGGPLVPTPNVDRSRIMAEMGSLGGRIGGKRRAENMSPEARKASASLAARARWAGKTSDQTVEEKREIAAEKIASILEKAMADMGLSEAQKDEKIAEMAAIVDSAVNAKIALRSKLPAQLRIVESPDSAQTSTRVAAAKSPGRSPLKGRAR
jgi:hypothetical protein